MKKEIRKGKFIPTITLAIKSAFKHGIDKEAAALAYYLLFALFPLSIFVSNLIGLLQLDIVEITDALYHLMPTAIVGIIEGYLEYVTNTASTTLFILSLIFLVWFPMRAVKVLMDNVHKAYQLGKPHSALSYLFRQLLFTLFLLLGIFMIVFVLTLGERVVLQVANILSNKTWHISDYVLTIWQYSRFAIVGVLMLLTLSGLYTLSFEKREPIKYVIPGILISMFAWMVVSLGFSYYVENFADYSLFYGTLGAVIVLLIWLYLTAIVLLFGIEFNGAFLLLSTKNKERNDSGENIVKKEEVDYEENNTGK